MPYGQEIGVVLPSEQQTPLQTYMQSSERMQRKKLMDEEKAQRLADQKRQDRLGAERYLDEALDYSKVATGVIDQDQFLLNSQNALRDKATQLMYQGGLSESELRSMMRNDLQDINNVSAQTKLTRAALDNELKGYAGSESLNLQRLQNAAYRKSFVDVDPNTGAVTQKAFGNIKPADIAQMILDDPEGFVNKDQAGQVTHTDLKNILEKSRGTSKEEYIDQDVKLKDGRIQKRKTKLSAVKLPGQEIYFDGDKPALRFKTESFVDDNKNEVKMLNNDSYNQYFAAPGAKAALMAEVNKRNPGKRIDFRTPAGERELKRVALDLVNDNRISGTDVRYSNLEDMSALQRGYGNSGGTREERKEQTAIDNSKKSPVFSLMDKDNLTTGTRASNGLRQVTQFLPGGKLMSTRKELKADGTSSTQAFSDVFIDDQKNYWVQDNPNSTLRMIKKENEYGFLKNIAESNNMSVKNFDKLWNETHPNYNSGVAKDDQTLLDETRTNALEKLKKGDYADFNKNWLGEHFTVSTNASGKIATGDKAKRTDDVQLLGFRKNNNGTYTIKYKYPDGKVITLDGQSQKDVNDFIAKPVTD